MQGRRNSAGGYFGAAKPSNTLALMAHPVVLDAETSLEIMAVADAIQWIALDTTPVALVAATITVIGGPLSEMPFVAHGFWHYLLESADYLPLSGVAL